MAIRVICPGCMTTFEVDDRFAGKKGPCPKCGHVIEIPKEKLVVHAPDEYTSGDKKQKILGHDARPIQLKRFAFTGGQVALGIVGAILWLAVAFVTGMAHSAPLAITVGALLLFAAAFAVADVGYMLIRDENDLEMFLGGERHRRALFASLVFAGSWILFELFLHFLGGTGPLACLFLIPLGAVGAMGALIFFDCNYGKALLVYVFFAFAAIIGRGLIIHHDGAPAGWIWQSHMRSLQREIKPAPEKTFEEKVEEFEGENAPPALRQDAKDEPEAAPAKPALSREAPKVDPTKKRRR